MVAKSLEPACIGAVIQHELVELQLFVRLDLERIHFQCSDAPLAQACRVLELSHVGFLSPWVEDLLHPPHVKLRHLPIRVGRHGASMLLRCALELRDQISANRFVRRQLDRARARIARVMSEATDQRLYRNETCTLNLPVLSLHVFQLRLSSGALRLGPLQVTNQLALLVMVQRPLCNTARPARCASVVRRIGCGRQRRGCGRRRRIHFELALLRRQVSGGDYVTRTRWITFPPVHLSLSRPLEERVESTLCGAHRALSAADRARQTS